MGSGDSGRIDWVSTPVQVREPFTPKFSGTECHNLDLEIQKMLAKGAITISSQEQGQFVSHLYLRPKKDRSQRPIFNLKPLNKFVQYEYFKMEGMPMVLDLVQEGTWMTTVDLKDAYFSVRIAQKDVHCEGYFARAPALQATSNAEIKSIVTGSQSYEALVVLTKECKEELAWWIDSLENWNGRFTIKASPDLAMQIKADASGTLVRPGGTGAHQPIGVESSILCPKGIHQGHDKHPSAPQVRQQSDSGSDQHFWKWRAAYGSTVCQNL